jgi:hypothetical protein
VVSNKPIGLQDHFYGLLARGARRTTCKSSSQRPQESAQFIVCVDVAPGRVNDDMNIWVFFEQVFEQR